MKTLVCAAALMALAAPAAAQVIRFEDATARLPAFDGHWTMDVGSADLDGDGDLDLVLPQEFRLNRILKNENGRFVDASDLFEPLSAEEMAGGPPQLQFPGVGHDSEDVSIADFDGDGRLDLIIVQEDDVKFGRTGMHEVYRGGRDGRWARAPGLPNTETGAVAHGDVDGDGDLDLIRAGLGPVTVWENDGEGRFTDSTARHFAGPVMGPNVALDVADFDGDGIVDLYVGRLNAAGGGMPDVVDRLFLGRR